MKFQIIRQLLPAIGLLLMSVFSTQASAITLILDTNVGNSDQYDSVAEFTLTQVGSDVQFELLFFPEIGGVLQPQDGVRVRDFWWSIDPGATFGAFLAISGPLGAFGINVGGQGGYSLTFNQEFPTNPGDPNAFSAGLTATWKILDSTLADFLYPVSAEGQPDALALIHFISGIDYNNDGDADSYRYIAAVPEPSSLLLMMVGLFGLIGIAVRRQV